MPSTFASLRHRNYRLLWFGTMVSSSGDWMDQIAFNWLVWELSHSPVWLAWANFARFLPILVFTLIGGVVADRVERRKLLFTTQTLAMFLATALAVIVSLGIAQLWMVIAIAAGRGIMNSFNQPARQSLISELVPEDDLANAIALNSATMNSTRVIGPAIGGLLIATVGMSGAFWVNAATFILLLGALAMMRFPTQPERRTRESVLHELVDGFRYIKGHPQLRLLVLLALIPILLGQPYVTMLPIFASDVLHIGGGGLGALNTASAVGAVVGSLSVASLPTGSKLGLWMLVGLAGFGLMLMGFALSHSLLLS
ncbi:MAG: MFS transporter, partial [Chloroflexota bacterium]